MGLGPQYWLRDGKGGGAAADLGAASAAGPSRPASPDTARPEPIGEGQPQNKAIMARKKLDINIRAWIDKLPPSLRNKYVVAAIVYGFWMLLFDQHSIMNQYRLNKTLQELQTKKAYFETEIEKDSRKRENLSTDDRHLEQFAREEHLMKKDDEDIFIIQKKP